MDNHHKPSAFETILARMNQEGQFLASVLASDDGLPVAYAPAPPPYDADTIAAMVALVKGFIKDTQTQLGMAEVDEVSIVVGDRSRLICRYFSLGEKPFVLATIAPPGQTYRRLTNRAIREIDLAWQA